MLQLNKFLQQRHIGSENNWVVAPGLLIELFPLKEWQRDFLDEDQIRSCNFTQRFFFPSLVEMEIRN